MRRTRAAGRLAGVLVLTAASLATAVPAAAAAAAARAPRAAPLFLFNSKLGLDAGHRGRGGAAVMIDTVSGSAGRLWVIARDGTIRPAYDTRLCLNVPHGQFRPGASLTVWRCDGTARERFLTRAPSAAARFFAIAPASGPRLCVTALRGLYAVEPAVLESCTSTARQAWSRAAIRGTGRIFTLGYRGGALDAATAKRGAPVTTKPPGYLLGEYWTAALHATSGGPQFTLRLALDPRLCLAIATRAAAGAPLVLQECDGSAAQSLAAVNFLHFAQYPVYLLLDSSASFCVHAAKMGTVVRLANCRGDSQDEWATTLDIGTTIPVGTTGPTIAAGPGPSSFVLSATAIASGGMVTLSGYAQAAGQFWNVVPAGGTEPGSPYTATIRTYVRGLCLTVPRADYAAGTQLQLSTCTGAADQQFLRAASGDQPPQNYGGQLLMPLAAGSLCAQASGGLKDGSPVKLASCSAAGTQMWWPGIPPTWHPPVFLKPYPVNSGFNVSLTGISSSGANVAVAAQRQGVPAQMWLPQNVSSGGTVFESGYDSAWCLNVPSASSGAAVTAGKCDGGSRQQFTALAVADPEYLEYQSAAFPSACLAQSATPGTPVVVEPCSSTDTTQMWWSFPAG